MFPSLLHQIKLIHYICDTDIMTPATAILGKKYYFNINSNRRDRLKNIHQVVQGSHFSGLTKFHDISMIFPGFLKQISRYFFIIFKVWFPSSYEFEYNYANLTSSFIWNLKDNFYAEWSMRLEIFLKNNLKFFTRDSKSRSQGWMFSSHQIFPGFISFFHDIY